MSWQYAYQTACEKANCAPREEIANIVELTSLTLNGNCPERFERRVTDAEVAVLCQALSSVPTVTEVDLSYNNIGDRGAIAFADLLRKNNSIQFISFAYNNIGPEGARALADALMFNMTVVSISLRGNDIGDEGGIALGTMLRGNNILVSLDLGACGLQTKSLVVLSQALQTHPALCSLNIDKPLLKGPHDIQYVIQHLSHTIAHTRLLVELSMNHFGLYDCHLQAMLPALVQNSSITALSLQGNKLSQDGGLLLGKLLARRPELVTLNVNANALDDEGAIALGTAVSTHACLQNLYLRDNRIGERGLNSLASALNANISVNNLLIWGNKFTEGSCRVWYALGPRLKSLNVDFEFHLVGGQPQLCQRND
jgi:Ran GTPase-activating protein (RanGAP) involved in mRNA processing and transport